MERRTIEQVKGMTVDEAAVEVANAVYAVTQLVEQLEVAGKIYGNGHHIRQEIAQLADNKIRERWNK